MDPSQLKPKTTPAQHWGSAVLVWAGLVLFKTKHNADTSQLQLGSPCMAYWPSSANFTHKCYAISIQFSSVGAVIAASSIAKRSANALG